MVPIEVFDNEDVLPNENNESQFVFGYRHVDPEDPFLEGKAMILSQCMDLKPVTFASATIKILNYYAPHLLATPATAESIKEKLTQMNKHLISNNVITELNAQAILQLLANALKKIAHTAKRDNTSNAYFLLHQQNYFASTLQLTATILMLIHKVGEDVPYGDKSWALMTGIPTKTLHYIEPVLLNLLMPQFKLIKANDVMFEADKTTLVAIEQNQPPPKTFPPLIFSDIAMDLSLFPGLEWPPKQCEKNQVYFRGSNDFQNKAQQNNTPKNGIVAK